MARIFFLLGLVILVAGFPLISSWISNNSDHKNHKIDKQAIESIIEEYIFKNPQKITNALRNGYKSLAESTTSKKIQDNIKEIKNASYPSLGLKNSKVTVTIFFDYSCGYCKMMLNDIKKLIQDNKVHIILRDLPILGEISQNAAQAALAIHFIDQKKYIDFYYAALALPSNKTLTNETILEIVESIDISEKDFKQSLNSNLTSIKKMIENNKILASKLGIEGTPSIIIGNSLLVGASDLQTIQSKINHELKNVS
ncbi:DsbA family protein [Neoehrlichia mikurensis]|uniref:DsbA family protein n=1 Tax=Neoehrlichia mikurensis TaxID=89586 RepID=A0A9Q9BVN6_9RICK|nr:DsbA family protein [Neoehrlichia mikurensis]QXK91702.1 DsbA family protein [Neoehrlichia mikurensis]QXK92913.1 DsbA family protein [Neoehrlichia mikurensis]QXK93393.1 DsbA family protein [Neoehrlichia mikurensis]UTO55658.1 DsbA family protein [Neoehrlichia mikurensis]UTO56579.1 DsbA family protein [Neoehrlichia mikurensis]